MAAAAATLNAAAGTGRAAVATHDGARPRWVEPWFAGLQPALDEVAGDALAGRWNGCIATLNRIARERSLVNERGAALRFVDARGIAPAAYEARIWETGEVPTRAGAADGWHDLFNALVWLAFPRTKARLNALQAQAIARDGVGATRGGLRDAATLFDENAAIVVADREFADALRAHDWQALFVRRRDAFAREVRVVAFGHALIDKLRRPYKAICAHAWIVAPVTAAHAPAHPIGDGEAAQLDACVRASLDEHRLHARAFAPLPVLGVPGWWPANRDPSFYDDAAVFRPARRRE